MVRPSGQQIVQAIEVCLFDFVRLMTRPNGTSVADDQLKFAVYWHWNAVPSVGGLDLCKQFRRSVSDGDLPLITPRNIDLPDYC